MASNKYGGVIWTHHALQRLKERGVSQELALSIFKNPEKSHAGKRNGTTEYHKQVDESKVTVITTLTRDQEPLVLSVIVNPPFPGSIEQKRKKRYWDYFKAPWWKKWIMAVTQQMGF